MTTDPHAIANLLEHATALRRKGALAEASGLYRRILQSEPLNSDALYFLAQLSCQEGNLSDGIELLRRSLVSDPSQGHAHSLLGMALTAAGRPQEALASFDAAIGVQPKLPSAHSGRGDVLAVLGRHEDAIASYDRALTLSSASFETWCNRGAALQEVGRHEEALASYERAIAIEPGFVEIELNIAIVLGLLGRSIESLARCETVLARMPDCVEAFIVKGKALRDLTRNEQAIASYDKALSFRPDATVAAIGKGAALLTLTRHEEALAVFESVLQRDARNIEALNGSGLVLNLLGRPAESLVLCDRLLEIRPDLVEGLNNRGNALCLLDRFEEGLSNYDRALQLAPHDVDTLANRAYALNSLGRSDEAMKCCDRALALEPECASALNHRGTSLMAMRRFEEALLMFDKVLMLIPDDIDAQNNRASALFSLNRFDDALAGYEATLRRAPDHIDAIYNRAMALYIMNRGHAAEAAFEDVLSRKPDHGKARIGACMARLPIIYANSDEFEQCRMAYEQGLLRLRADLERQDVGRNSADAMGSMQPYYLAYQGRNDRELQALYGSIVCAAMAKKYPPAAMPPPPGPTEPIRVGLVTAFFFQHSVWKCLVKGWMSEIDRSRFRLFGYHTASATDSETEAAASVCERFVRGPLPVQRWRQEILSDAPHVLIYPEIGMDPVCPQLAGQRLAPVQCNSWGHPTTSGFPTLDYFISSDLMEPANGQDHYTERLIRLPNLSGYYEPAQRQSGPVEMSDFGYRPGALKFWSPQSLYKYLPRFDWIFPRIAQQAGNCQFVFIQDKSRHVTDTFYSRLAQEFEKHGLEAESHFVLLPRMDHGRFIGAMRECDIFLDSLGWSGCTTSLESLPYELPMVTMAGQLMRGRHTAAFLRMMDLNEMVADNVEDYVEIATRLAVDLPWRVTIKERIRLNQNKLYHDQECIRGLEMFLDRVARGLVP